VLYDFIIVAVVVACLAAIHFAFDAMQRRKVKR
jgi:preprotein translocase subunit SecE